MLTRKREIESLKISFIRENIKKSYCGAKKRGIIAQDNSINNLNQSTSLDLDIHSLFKLLFNSRGFILKNTFFITIIFIIYSLIATPYFESKITVYPAGSLVDSGNMMNNLQGIAESFGLGGGGNGQTFNIPDIVNSRRLKKSLILNNWNSKKFEKPVNLIQFWEIDKPNWVNPKSGSKA